MRKESPQTLEYMHYLPLEHESKLESLRSCWEPPRLALGSSSRSLLSAREKTRRENGRERERDLSWVPWRKEEKKGSGDEGHLGGARGTS